MSTVWKWKTFLIMGNGFNLFPVVYFVERHQSLRTDVNKGGHVSDRILNQSLRIAIACKRIPSWKRPDPASTSSSPEGKFGRKILLNLKPKQLLFLVGVLSRWDLQPRCCNYETHEPG